MPKGYKVLNRCGWSVEYGSMMKHKILY